MRFSPQVPLDSIASHSGCKSGDYLVKIADKDVFDLGHEEAKELIRRAGNRLSLVLERGEKIVPSMNSAFPKQKSDEPIEEKAKTYSQMVGHLYLYLRAQSTDIGHVPRRQVVLFLLPLRKH